MFARRCPMTTTKAFSGKIRSATILLESCFLRYRKEALDLRRLGPSSRDVFASNGTQAEDCCFSQKGEVSNIQHLLGASCIVVVDAGVFHT